MPGTAPLEQGPAPDGSVLWALGVVMLLLLSGVMFWLIVLTFSEVRVLGGDLDRLRLDVEHLQRMWRR